MTIEGNDTDCIEVFRSSLLNILSENNGFDIAPSSNKMVVFDHRLLVKDSFLGLIEQDLKCGLVLDNENKSILKIITVTDFIKIILYANEKGDKSLEELTIKRWNEMTDGNSCDLKFIMSSDSLLKGIQILRENRIHRLPVMTDRPNNVLCLLNYQRILRFILKRYMQDEQNSNIMKSIKMRQMVAAGLGNFSEFTTANINDSVFETLNKIREKELHCIPLLNDDGKYVDSYTSSDVRYLALDGNYRNLEISNKKALGNHHNRKYGRVVTCKLEDTLYSFVEKVIKSRKYASVCLGDKNEILGIIAVKHFFEFVLGEKQECKGEE